MSEFGNYLKTYVRNTGISSRELAGRMGIDPALISGFITGRRKGCNPPTLAKMVKGISADPQVQAGLLEAYMREQVVKEMKPWITVQSGRGDQRAREEIKKAYGGSISELSRILADLSVNADVINALKTLAQASAKAPQWRRLVTSLGETAHDYLEGR